MSNYRTSLLTSLACVIVIFSLSCGAVLRGKQSQRRNLVDTLETSNEAFRIRVNVYDEKNPIWLTKYYYVFESAAIKSSEWREIMTVNHDDNIPIPRDNIKFLTEQIGYVSMANKFAVTITGGNYWSVWDTEENLPDCERCNRASINEVQITPDGSGIMKLAPRSNKVDMIELYTKDFGQHWNTRN